jgi:hypothetical protein
MVGYRQKTTHNSTYPKGRVSCSKDSFVVNQTLVFQIKYCGKSPALWGSCKTLAIIFKIIEKLNYFIDKKYFLYF